VARHLTGRAVPLTLWPFSQGELSSRRERFLDRLHAGDLLAAAGRATLARNELIDRAITGGYPLAVARAAGPSRSRWFRALVELVVERDATNLRAVRQPEVIERLLGLAAARTATVLNIADIARDAQVTNETASELLRLLETTFLVVRLPAWSENLNARIAHRPKVHIADPGLAAHLLKLTPAALSRASGAALARLGQLLETFAATELLRQGSWRDPPPTLHHLRTHDGVELDLVVEFADGSVAGIEVKAASRIVATDLRGLRFLRDRVGDRFRSGVVLCTTEVPIGLEDRITALPFEALWTL
jgi:predicted AAA+ superfamily ATPase